MTTLFDATATDRTEWHISSMYSTEADEMTPNTAYKNVADLFTNAISKSGTNCQLCNTKIEHRFYISCPKIECSAIVGSDCVTKFLSENDSEIVKQLVKERTKSRKARKVALAAQEQLEAALILQEKCVTMLRVVSDVQRKQVIFTDVSKVARGLTYRCRHTHQLKITKFMLLSEAYEAYNAALAALAA